jgi:hypothetical protein
MRGSLGPNFLKRGRRGNARLARAEFFVNGDGWECAAGGGRMFL